MIEYKSRGLEGCTMCHGTGFQYVTEPGDGIVGAVRDCGCVRQKQLEARLKQTNVPPRHYHCTLANFNTYTESLERALKDAQRFVDSPHPVVERGLFLEGDCGTGKTHLAVATLMATVRRTGLSGLFYSTHDLLSLIRSTYRPGAPVSEVDVLHPVKTVYLLVLDDIGAERFTDWVEDKMHEIVNARYNARLMTIFTSNYPDIPPEEQMEQDPLSREITLTERIGRRLRSRVHEMSTSITLHAADYRMKPPNGGTDDLQQLWKQKCLRAKKGLSTGPSSRRPLRAQLRGDGKADLKWTGGRGGSH